MAKTLTPPREKLPDDFESLDSFESLGYRAQLNYEMDCARHKCQSLFIALKKANNRDQVIKAITAIENVTLHT